MEAAGAYGVSISTSNLDCSNVSPQGTLLMVQEADPVVGSHPVWQVAPARLPPLLSLQVALLTGSFAGPLVAQNPSAAPVDTS